jgi:hypothetical protein
LPPAGAVATMRLVRRLGLILALVCALAPASAVAASSHARATTPRICTAFGKTWASKYNAAGGPVKIVSVCCGLRSLSTHTSACKVMVTVRKGPGEGTFGCGVATVAANGNILANRPQACVRSGGIASLPT